MTNREILQYLGITGNCRFELREIDGIFGINDGKVYDYKYVKDGVYVPGVYQTLLRGMYTVKEVWQV